MASDRLGRVPTIVRARLVPAIALVTGVQFSPSPLVVKAGAAVTVTNDDGTVHTLTADDGTFDTGNLDGGAKKTVTIDAPGTYAYHCNIHTYMTGTIEAK
jgi:plastocyanin